MMREFIEKMREKGLVTDIEDPVSADMQAPKMAAATDKLLFFHNIDGVRAVMNLTANRTSLALALGMVEPVPGRENELASSIQGEGVFLVSWSALGAELKRTMPREILLVSLGLMAGILLILAVGLRDDEANRPDGASQPDGEALYVG